MSDAVDLLTGFADGTDDPVSALDRSLEALASTGAELNAVTRTTEDSARSAAEVSRERWRTGTPRALDGVPIGLKDIVALSDVPMTAGSRILGNHIPSGDAAVVARLRAAGAVVVAKLATFAFANGDPVNIDFGVTRNPADPTLLTGGSSSGSAAAVGGGCVPIAVGSDTGGSIRLPAAYCGVAGLKPTFGRVSRHGVVPLAWTLDHVGPLARSVRDLRLALGVIEGIDERDPSTAHRRADALFTCGAGIRVGVPDTHFLDGLDRVTAQAFDDVVRLWSEAGATVVDVHIDDLDLAEPIARTIITAEAASLHEALQGHIAEYDDLLGARLEAAGRIRATDYLKALRLRVRLAQAMADVFADCDVIATPTTPTVAPSVDTLTVDGPGGPVPWLDVAARNTIPFNLSGLPTVSVPVPSPGAPVGLQLAGPMWSDRALLASALALETTIKERAWGTTLRSLEKHQTISS